MQGRIDQGVLLGSSSMHAIMHMGGVYHGFSAILQGMIGLCKVVEANY